MKKNIKPPVKTLKEKICVFIIVISMSSVIYFIATSLRDQELENIEFIKSNYQTTRGIVTKNLLIKVDTLEYNTKLMGEFMKTVMDSMKVIIFMKEKVLT